MATDAWAGERGWLNQPACTPNWWRGETGMRAGWRAALFILLAIIFLFALALITPRALLRWLAPHGGITPGFVALNEFLLLLPIAAASFIMTRLEGRTFLSCGLAGPRLARLAGGFAAGLALLILLILLLAATGHAITVWGGLPPGGVFGFAIAWAAASLLTGLAEELAFRGYLLQILCRGLGAWPAIALTSLLFAALHASNSGEGATGLATAALGGAIMALGIRGTGTLWWSIGFHGGWDYAENFWAGTPDSGQICAYTLLRTMPHGNAWLSGGATGPEGSLFALAVLAAALALAWAGFARKPSICAIKAHPTGDL